MMANVVAKGMSGRPKTVERASETCMMLCELEASEAVVEALLKGSNHKVPKVVLACTQALTRAVESFGTPSVVPAKPILKGVSHLFESKDAKVRDAAKALTVELTRWLGPDAVRRDLLEKMRAGMQAEVTEMTAAAPARAPRATRQLRKDGDRAEAEPMDVDGGEGGADAGGDPAAASAFPDAYEFSDPADVLDTLEKAPANKEQPKFWGAVASSKWKERLGALTQLRELADHPRLASGDYGDVARAIKRVVTKDANIACVGEACASAGALAKGLRREFRSEARLVLPGMLDKLKDKNASVVQKNQDALLEFSRHCFTLADVADDVVAALGHKMPKVRAQTMAWIAAAAAESDKTAAAALHKTIVPAIVKCADHREPDVRAAAIDALAAVGRAGGGWRSIARHVDALDDARKAKVEEACGAAGKAAPLAAVDVNRPNATSTVAIKPARPATAAASRPGFASARARPATAGGNPKPVVASMRSTGGAAASSAFASSAADAEVSEGAPASKEEVVERMTALFGSEAVEQLQSGDWKQRLAGVGVAAEAVRAMSPAEADDAREVVTRGLAVVPGFDDKNFQVLGRVFEILGALADKAAGFSKPDGARVVSGAAQKVADVKLRGPATAALMSVTEALGPKFVVAQLHKHTATHKNPKVTAEALLFCASAVSEFGVETHDVAFNISWCKSSLGASNPACKSAAGKFLGAMHAGLGPALRDFLSDLKDTQMKNLDAEFARNPHEPGSKPARTVRATVGASAATSGGVGGGGGGSLPRADISGLITDKLVRDMGDANWKVRAAAVESVGEILAGANWRVGPNTGDLLPSLAKRFADNNRNLAATALTTAGKVAEAMGAAIGERRNGHGVVGDVAKQFADSKAHVRAAAATALDAWCAAAGLAKTLPHVADKMVELTAKMSGDGKADALAWVHGALVGPAGEEGAAGDVDLAHAVAAAAAGLADIKSQARAAGGKVMDEVTRRVGSKTALAMCHKINAPATLKTAAATHVDKGGAVAPSSAPSSANPSPSTSPLKSTRANGNGALTARGGVRASATGLSSLRASRSGALRASATSASTSELAAGPVLAVNEEKESRLRKMPKKPVKFEVPRDEQLKLAEEELKAAMMSFVRGDVHAMLFKDFKAHIQAMEHLETALAESPECVPGNLDLLLRWVVLRFCEQTPNTQSLLRVLDFTAEALGVAKDQGVRLTEQEGALFLPALVDKCGHSMEAVREKFRKILRLIPGVYPASRLCGHLVRGLDSKNSKTRLEVLEILENLMERHGLDVVERGGNKALAEIVKLVEARDAAMRAAASSCLVFAYKVGGEDAWKYIGRVGGQMRDALEDKFAKAEKEMDRKNEGRPGAWLKDGRLVGRGTGIAHAAVGAVPVPAALVGASTSRSIAAPGRLAATASAVGSPIAAAAAAVLRPFGAAVSSIIPGRRNAAKETDTSEPLEAAAAVPEEDRLVGWTRALGAVASVSDAEAVEGMKAMCHEIMGVAGDAATLAAMAPDVDRLVGLLAKRISPIFVAAAVAPGPSTARACKYVLNTLMQVFQEPALASAVGEANERMIVAALLERLLDAAVLRMEEGPQLVKALNVLMLKVLEHCPRTSSFRALLRLLATPPESVADDEATTARFNELVVKCLIKLTKALGATLHEVRLPELLQEIHAYFDALGTEEIRRRGRASDGGDKPLRMVKTILHKVTEIVGHNVYDSMGLCPPRDADPAPIIYAYVELNLQSMPDAPGVPRHFEPLAKPETPKAPTPQKAEPTPQMTEPTPETAPAANSPEAPAAPPTPEPEPAAASPAPEPQATKSPFVRLRATDAVEEERLCAASEPVATTVATPELRRPKAQTPVHATTPAATMVGAGGDVEMTDAFRPPTPVSADLKSRLANIFKKIGEKSTTAKGLEELYDFSRAYPRVDIQPHLARTSGAFQGYIKRGLAKVEAARAQQAAAKAAATPGRVLDNDGAPAIAPSPMPQMERTAAEVYRERLAAMAAAKAAGGKAAPAAARPASTSAGLTTLRERMDRIAAKAAGGAAGGATGGTAGGAGRAPDAQQTFEDLQARMERIRVGTSAAAAK